MRDSFFHPVIRISIGSNEVVHCLDQSHYTIGRAKHCSICLHHKEISRIHATLVKDDCGQFHLLDGDGLYSESSNGTFVNGNRIDRQVLQAGDIIHFGKLVVGQFYHDQPIVTGAKDQQILQS